MSGPRSGYLDLETLVSKDPVTGKPDGVVAVISKRVANGQLAVALFKEFDRDGQAERTAFMQRRHLEAVERLIPEIRDRFDAIEDQERAALRQQRRR